ncbi:MAG TPA: hypothetical protein DIW47_03335 [Bacteroidetes bacterium]|nr:hypothetical protein [Bacteroidota bacterium]
MKKHISVLLGAIFSLSAYGQNSEFTTYSNGLIYSEQTMNKLAYIVDSLNLEFKVCDFNRVFYSKSQTIGHLVTLKSGDIEQARKDLENEIPFDSFLKKYPTATVQREVLILKWRYTNYKKQEVAEIEHFDLRGNYGFSIDLADAALYDKDYTGTWLYSYRAKTTYSDETLTAFYFPGPFTSVPIPQKYALMVGYADCLIDTNTTKFKEDLEEGWVELPNNWTRLPEKKQKKLLEEMRSTRVLGFCSMDNRPRQHAVNIALLSAETYSWEVFLKAHLDIMNDRFERVSDGSYAWGHRATYIKELEELHINVTDLILGISLRVENPATNHYYGSIGRLGRALAQTNKRAEVEEAILAAIADPELDHYNRLLFYFLFKNYNYHIADMVIKQENSERLKKAAETLPDYLYKELANQ